MDYYIRNYRAGCRYKNKEVKREKARVKKKKSEGRVYEEIFGDTAANALDEKYVCVRGDYFRQETVRAG